MTYSSARSGGDSLYSEKDRIEITALYVESIILQLDSTLTKTAALLCILEHLSVILDRIADRDRLEKIYAIAATPAGKALMTDLGFELQRPAERRKDAHDLFVARPSDIENRVAMICRGRLKNAVACDAGL